MQIKGRVLRNDLVRWRGSVFGGSELMRVVVDCGHGSVLVMIGGYWA